MEKIRVNKITVNVDKEDDSTTISLYKTNQLLGIIHEYDLDISPFSLTGVSMKAYQLYCKDIVINLLEHDGINGFYYKAKEDHESIKYDIGVFRNKVQEYIISLLGDKHTVYMTQNDDIIENEKYNDRYIKNATVKFNVKIDSHSIDILSTIKSGQMCKPKLIYYNEAEYTFNISNFKKILK